MLIPINVIRTIRYPDMYTVWDTEGLCFREVKSACVRCDLPVMDGFSCELVSGAKITVIGYCRSGYVCSFGLNDVFLLSKSQLLAFRAWTNVRVDKLNRVYVLDSGLPDLTSWFPDEKLRFSSFSTGGSTGSLGQARKFFALYDNHFGVCKRSRVNDIELRYEVLYKRVADIWGIICCPAKMVRYANRDWVFSQYLYNPQTQIFQSFRQLGEPVGEIYNSLCRDDKLMFDKMMILDYCMEQSDRHVSNLALVDNRLYALYDNGACLGLEPIGHESFGLRRYVEQLPKNYIINTLGFNLSGYTLEKLGTAFGSQFREELNRFIANYRRLLEVKNS